MMAPPQRNGRNPLLTNVRLAEAVREGLITPATAPSGEPPPRKPMIKFEDLMAELQRDREDR